MILCRTNHLPIVYDVSETLACPLCAAWTKIEDLKDQLQDMEGRAEMAEQELEIMSK